MKLRFAVIFVLLLVFTSQTFAQDAAALKTKGDKYWPKRDDQVSLVSAIRAYEGALAASPGDLDLMVRLSLAYYWKGNNLPVSDGKDRKAAYEKGINYAQKVCDKNPDHIGGNFWWAVNKASYGRERGVVASSSYLPDLKRHMAVVEQQDKYYFYGGPQRFWAKVIIAAPGFLRSKFGGTLDDAALDLKKAVSKEPKLFMNHLALAEVYLEMKKPDLAKKEIQFILDTPANSLPQYAAENRRDKKVANRIMGKHFNE